MVQAYNAARGEVEAVADQAALDGTEWDCHHLENRDASGAAALWGDAAGSRDNKWAEYAEVRGWAGSQHWRCGVLVCALSLPRQRDPTVLVTCLQEEDVRWTVVLPENAPAAAGRAAARGGKRKRPQKGSAPLVDARTTKLEVPEF